jgi:long-chain acyl-CoA synthetase
VTNLSLSVIETARRRPEEIAIRLDEAEVSFANLDAASACVAGLLVGRGLAPGDRVGVMLPNVTYFAMVYYGVLRAGGVVVPMNVLLTAPEVIVQLSDSGASFVIAWPDFVLAAQVGAEHTGAECIVVTPGDFEELIVAAEPIGEPVARADTDTAVILYPATTGGKRAELTHEDVRGNVASVVALLGLSESDVVLGALPLFQGVGQTAGLNAAIVAGSCLTLVPWFTPEKAISVIERDHVTVFEGLPTMFAAMVHSTARGHSPSLRLSVSDGSAMPAEILREFEKTFGCQVLQGKQWSEGP